MNIGILEIVSEEITIPILQSVSKSRREKAALYKNTIDQKISLYSELLLRVMLKGFGISEWKKIKISSTRNGKLFLQHHDDVFCSLSHSKNRILCAVDKKNKMGVDIEEVTNSLPQIPDFFFHRKEREQLAKEQDKLYFFKIWTAKEAYCKYTGDGLSKNLHQTNILSSKFKQNILQWIEDNFFYAIYADRINSINIHHYNEAEINAHYD